MKILSLFDGISCARVALERAGIPVEAYYASEVDKYAMQISAKNYPDIVQLGSVTAVKVKIDCYDSINDRPYNLFHFVKNKFLSSVEMPKIDLLIGGSPCQDLSIAKKNRKGLDGERSGLFWEYVRILKEVKPKYFILENVNSMPKEAKAIITETLGVQPIMINAALVSAQNRKRLFWCGRLVGNKYEQIHIDQPEDRGILLRDILQPTDEIPPSFFIKVNYEKEVYEVDKVAIKWREQEKSKTIRTSGRGSGIDDKHNWDTIRIGQIGKGGQGDRIYSQEGKSVALSAQGGGRGAKTGLYAVALTETRTDKAKKARSEHMKETGKDYSPRRDKELKPRNDFKANTITTGQTKESLIMVAAPAKSYCIPATYYKENVKSLIKRKKVGLMVAVPVALRNRGEGKKPEYNGTDKANSMTTVQTDSMVEIDFKIRKLTPTECMRLQGLPDGYCDGVSNSQQYKMLGNGFCVDVVSHILSFINKPVTKKD